MVRTNLATVRPVEQTIKEVDAARYVCRADKFRFGDVKGGHEKAAELDAVGFNIQKPTMKATGKAVKLAHLWF